MRYAMIMAGGSGTRLWPMSRDGQPKQLIEFIHRPDGSRVSLLELAARRMDDLVPDQRQYICTGERYRDAIRAALPRFDDAHLLGEPTPRDTVNAVAFTAAVLAKDDPDAVFGVLTADQIIEPADVFASRLELGYTLVEQDPTRLITFGITPTHPATGYGYIERDRPIEGTEGCAFTVARFVEKPDSQTAQAYLRSGRFDWNAGMFVFHARTFLDLFERYLPRSAAGIGEIGAAWGTDAQREVLERVYPTLEKTSVDYGVMEPASRDDGVTIVGVQMPVTWLDVGSWPAYAETLEPDERGNRCAGAVLATLDASDNIVIGEGSDGHTIAIVGCEDLIVVRTERATLVIPRERAQDIKALHASLPEALR